MKLYKNNIQFSKPTVNMKYRNFCVAEIIMFISWNLLEEFLQ